MNPYFQLKEKNERKLQITDRNINAGIIAGIISLLLLIGSIYFGIQYWFIALTGFAAGILAIRLFRFTIITIVSLPTLTSIGMIMGFLA